jgi:hypothetical protein
LPTQSGRVHLRLSFDAGEIGDRERGLANAIEELEAVFAQRLVVGVHRDFLEEGIGRRAQLRHRAHRRLEVFLLDRRGDFDLGLQDRGRERYFLGRIEPRIVERAGIRLFVLLLLVAQVFRRTLLTGELVFSVGGIEEFPERLHAPHDH